MTIYNKSSVRDRVHTQSIFLEMMSSVISFTPLQGIAHKLQNLFFLMPRKTHKQKNASSTCFEKQKSLSRIQDGEKRLNAVICGQNAPRRYSGGLISAVHNSAAYIRSINGLKPTIVVESTVEKNPIRSELFQKSSLINLSAFAASICTHISRPRMRPQYYVNQRIIIFLGGEFIKLKEP